jgi:hypothetical protein
VGAGACRRIPVLIAPDVVLLAAHCLDPDTLTYGYGSLEDEEIRWTRQADLSAWTGEQIVDWPADAVPAWDWVYHEQFDVFSMSMGLAHNYDVGLLFLNTALTGVPLAVLPTTDDVAQIAQGAAVEIVGWGQQTADVNPPAGTYGYKQMAESFINELAEWEFQVGASREDARKCHGDSGGPTFLQVTTGSTDPWRQVGVTSHAYDASDCRRTGGVDTRVDAYLDWIDQELRARCQDGTRVWCEEEGIPAAPLPEPEDTGDTAGDEDGDGEDEDGDGGCGCTGRAAAPLGLLALAPPAGAALLLRRRRQPVIGKA